MFFEYRETLRRLSDRAHFVSLPDNFRSHGDILALVDAVFSQDRAFGSEFCILTRAALLTGRRTPSFADLERVRLDIIHYKAATAAASGVTRAEAVEEAARHIAERFAALRDRGRGPSDMAVLLGTMGNADVYAKALREVGLESVIAGGSVFSTTAEARLVADLFCAMRSMRLTKPPCSPSSPRLFFAVSDDALLSLVVTCDEDGAFGRRSLWRGFSDPREDESTWIGEEDARMLALARRTLGRFFDARSQGAAERALRELFLETGYLDRLQKCGAVGLAAAGNLCQGGAHRRRFRGECLRHRLPFPCLRRSSPQPRRRRRDLLRPSAPISCRS